MISVFWRNTLLVSHSLVIPCLTKEKHSDLIALSCEEIEKISFHLTAEALILIRRSWRQRMSVARLAVDR